LCRRCDFYSRCDETSQLSSSYAGVVNASLVSIPPDHA